MGYRTRCSWLLGLTALAGATVPLAAQAEEGAGKPDLFWGTAGLGLGTQGAAVLGELNLAVDAHLFSLRTFHTFGIDDGQRADYGVLYGRMKRWPRGHARASIGVALVEDGFDLGSFPDAVGVPLGGGVAWTPLPALGLGLTAVADINAAELIGGLALTVEIGRLR